MGAAFHREYGPYGLFFQRSRSLGICQPDLACAAAGCVMSTVSIGRQPIFDRQRKLWGYELFCLGLPAGSSVAADVQSSAYVCLQQITQAGKNVMLDFSEKSIIENLPYVLPPDLATVRIFEQASRNRTVIESLARQKSDGYRVAVGGFTGNPDFVELYRLADILCIDAAGEHLSAAPSLDTARRHDALLLASRVQNESQFKDCRDLEFSLFHGPFFKKPDRVSVRKLTSNEVVRLRLLKTMESAEFDVVRLADTIQSDVTISVRLLGYLNSAAFAFTQKIKSVSQAINLLGPGKVKSWLRVILLSDMSQSGDAHELVLLSAQRGLFLELLTKDHDFWGFDPDSLHLLGLFSLLDTLLGVPMFGIVANLPLDHKMKAALCQEPDNEYVPLLQLAQCLEEARWEDSEKLALELNLDMGKVRQAFQSSVDWASELESIRSA
jgi:EAL and modified HD-GYP domain-containing signal transduction protein